MHSPFERGSVGLVLLLLALGFTFACGARAVDRTSTLQASDDPTDSTGQAPADAGDSPADASVRAPFADAAPQQGTTDAPLVKGNVVRLPVTGGRLAFPPLDTWQDRRVRLSDFQLDETEITIARLRRYVERSQGQPPEVGAGAVAAIQGSGWKSGWDEKVSLAITSEQLRLSLTDRCDLYDGIGAAITYDDEALRPANCISWFTALALCISEGGRLPTVAEWTYAAEGGSEGRLYPWGDDSPTTNHVAMGCLGDGASGCTGRDLLNVASRPLGAGRWGHMDLAGSLEEWMMDGFEDEDHTRLVRSSGFELDGDHLLARSELYGRGTGNTDWYTGARCMSD